MQLSTYLEKQNVSASEFAAKIGVSRQAIWRYMAGERLPRAAILHRIETATGGKVKPADFFGPAPKQESAA